MPVPLVWSSNPYFAGQDPVGYVSKTCKEALQLAVIIRAFQPIRILSFVGEYDGPLQLSVFFPQVPYLGTGFWGSLIAGYSCLPVTPSDTS
jgi:hypothetical protein